MLAHGAEQVVIDGAIDRRAASSPEVSDGLVMSTGAILSEEHRRGRRAHGRGGRARAPPGARPEGSERTRVRALAAGAPRRRARCSTRRQERTRSPPRFVLTAEPPAIAELPARAAAARAGSCRRGRAPRGASWTGWSRRVRRGGAPLKVLVRTRPGCSSPSAASPHYARAGIELRVLHPDRPAGADRQPGRAAVAQLRLGPAAGPARRGDPGRADLRRAAPLLRGAAAGAGARGAPGARPPGGAPWRCAHPARGAPRALAQARPGGRCGTAPRRAREARRGRAPARSPRVPGAARRGAATRRSELALALGGQLRCEVVADVHIAASPIRIADPTHLDWTKWLASHAADRASSRRADDRSPLRHRSPDATSGSRSRRCSR